MGITLVNGITGVSRTVENVKYRRSTSATAQDCIYVKVNNTTVLDNTPPWDFASFIATLDSQGSSPFAVSQGQKKYVTLTNSIWTGDWIVIGINHDGTSNTVDLIPTRIMGSGTNGTFSSNSQLYHKNGNNNDYLRYYIENNIVNGFDTAIKNRLTTFTYVVSEGTGTGQTGASSDTLKTYSAKAVALSWAEIGGSENATNYCPKTEGSRYEFFSSGKTRGNTYGTDLDVKFVDGPSGYSHSSGFWGLRSRNAVDSSGVLNVYSNGGINGSYYTGAYFGALPRIRFTQEPHYTFSEFISILDSQGSSPFAISQGQKKYVTLTNSIWSGDWIVIGIDHDSTTNTVDLMPTKIMGGRNRTSTSSSGCYDFSSNSQLYHYNNNANDYLRYYIENDIVNGFSSEIKNRLTQFNYTCSEGTATGSATSASSDSIVTYSAKAVALSLAEVGCTQYATNHCPKQEGTKYEFFSGSKSYGQTYGTDLDLKFTDGVTTRFYLGGWGLRSRGTFGSDYVMSVNSSGRIGYDYPYTYAHFGAVPRIRFTKS